jgi:hypothetical protein
MLFLCLIPVLGNIQDCTSKWNTTFLAKKKKTPHSVRFLICNQKVRVCCYTAEIHAQVSFVLPCCACLLIDSLCACTRIWTLLVVHLHPLSKTNARSPAIWNPLVPVTHVHHIIKASPEWTSFQLWLSSVQSIPWVKSTTAEPSCYWF